jgi:hypothetical protein
MEGKGGESNGREAENNRPPVPSSQFCPMTAERTLEFK